MKTVDRLALEAQKCLVARYVAGDLSRSERAEFEAWLVASPELAAECEMERRMRRGIASAARRGWLKRGETTFEDAPLRRLNLAMAASLVIALMALGLGMVSSRHDDRTSASEPGVSALPRVAMARTVRLGSVRGLGTSADVSFARAEAPGELTIQPEVVVLTCADGTIDFECAGGIKPSMPQYPEYEMDLVARRGSTLAWRSARQVPMSGTALSFTIPNPGSLSSGDYDMIVRGHSPDHEEVVARFWLHVTEQ
jgi:hypothetical protein